MQFRPIRETDLTGVQEVKKQFVFTPIGKSCRREPFKHSCPKRIPWTA